MIMTHNYKVILVGLKPTIPLMPNPWGHRTSYQVAQLWSEMRQLCFEAGSSTWQAQEIGAGILRCADFVSGAAL